MSISDIPVRVMGPGSQPEEQDKLSYIDMPGDMAKYQKPWLPEELDDLPGVREAMHWLRNALAGAGAGREPQLADLSPLDDDSRELVNQILG